MKKNQENITISFHEWLNHLSRLVTVKGTLRSILVTGREQRCLSGWFPRTYSSGGSKIPQVTSGELGSAPSSLRGQMTSQTALTISYNWLVESVSSQIGHVSLAKLRKTCGRTDPASEGWPCCIGGTLCANWNPMRRLSLPGVPVAQWSWHPTGVCGGPGFDSYLEL